VSTWRRCVVPHVKPSYVHEVADVSPTLGPSRYVRYLIAEGEGSQERVSVV
jgi:hypothetical protein